MLKSKLISLIGFFCFLYSGNLYTQETLHYSANSDELHLHDYMEVFLDESGLVSENDILDYSTFESYSKKTANSKADGYWVRFTIKNEKITDQRVYLNTSYFDTVEVFQLFDNDSLSFISKSGFLIPRKDDLLKINRTNVFSLDLFAGTTTTYYLRLYSRSTGSKNFTAMSFSQGFDVLSVKKVEQSFFNTHNHSFLLAGAILITFFFNIILAFKGNEPIYYYLAVYNLLVGLTFLNSFGYFASIDLFSSYNFMRAMHYSFPILVITTYGLFAIRFLEVNIHFGRLFRLIRTILIVQLISIPLYFLGYLELGIALTVIIVITASTGIYYTVFTLLKKGKKEIWPFIIGSGLNVIFFLNYVPALFIESTDYYQREFALFVAVFVELLLFTYATIKKFLNFRRNAFELNIKKNLLLEQQEKMQFELEQKKQEVLSKITAQKSTYQEHKDILELLIEAESGSSRDLYRAKEKMKTLVRNKAASFDFLKHFEGVHTGFTNRLQEKFPTLSSNEIKLCAYLKMNLSSYDIAQLQGVEKSSINQARFRLRKKLGIDKSVDLVLFISNI